MAARGMKPGRDKAAAARESAISVLLPRPKGAAAAAAAKLRAAGFSPFIVPLSRITPLACRLPQQNFTALLATSANAFCALPATEEISALQSLPLYCVGAKTAAAARAKGFGGRCHIAETVAALSCFLAQPAQERDASSLRLLYLAGAPRRAALEIFLRKAAISCQTAELYRAEPRAPSAAELAALPRRLDYILLYSGQNAAAMPLLRRHIGAATRFLCLSARIAQALPPLWQQQARIAPKPTQAALLALLPKGGGKR